MTEEAGGGGDAAEEARLQALAEIGERFIGAIPHNRALNLEITGLLAGEATMRVPWDERFVGDPATGVLHGGVITALLDSCSGAAVLCHPSGVTSTATIDLRIDYMRPARPGKAINCKAVCFRATRSVAFVRGMAWDEDEDDLVAASSGAFTVERGGEMSPAAAAAAEMLKKVLG